MARDKDIAIVGMSCYFPGAKTIGEFWNNLVNGVDSVTKAPEERIHPIYFSESKKVEPDRFYFNKGGFVDPITIDPLQYGLLPIAAEGTDAEHLISLQLVKDALTDAGVYEKNIPLQKCCFILGKGGYSGLSAFRIAEYVYQAMTLEVIAQDVCPGASAESLEKIRKEYQMRLGRFQADTAAGMMPNLVVSQAVNRFNMKGPAYTVDAACASSLIAVEQAVNFLLNDQCDIALAGGMHLSQGASFWSVFNLLGAASHKGEISPFSEDADGLLIGEGAGLVVLKRLEKAIADNDRIYAVLKGCASCSDGSDVSVIAPSSKGQVATLQLAWERAGMDPQKIGYVEAHGTATQVGDRTEIATITEFFGNQTTSPALLGSVKSNIGHAMCASGIAGLIKTVLALYYRKIPPTLHCEKPMKAMFESRFMPVQKLTDWDGEKYPLVAAVNAFGFGGINGHAILEPYISSNASQVDGLTVNREMLEIMETNPAKGSKPNAKMAIEVNFATKMIMDYPAFREVVEQYVERRSGAFSTFSAEELEDPVLQEANANLREIVTIQNSLLKWYRSTNPNRRRSVLKTKSENGLLPDVGFHQQRAGTTVEKTIRFDLENHPYLMDHMIVRQPAHRPLEEKNPVVPFTMTIETLCELTEELVPAKKIVCVNSAKVLKWIPVREPFVAKVTGQWKTDDCISWALPDYVNGEITVSDSFPEIPEEYTEEIDLGDDNLLPQLPSKDRIYSMFMFHGPKYQSIIDLVKLTKKGLRAHIHKVEGKGSLLDNLGQLLGLYIQLTVEDNRITFPMRVEELRFFQDFHDQKGVFEYTLVIKEIKDTEVVSSVVIKRDDKVWCVVKGWHNQRLNYGQAGANIIMFAEQCILAKNLNKNVYYYYNDPYVKVSILDFLRERYLNAKERKHYFSLYPNQARNFLISRIALKDGVRKYIQKGDEDMIYPIDIEIVYDEKGKPHLSGHEKLKGIEISIAHKGSEAVAMISDQPVGIDIEKIEARSKEFVNLSCTPRELDLLKEKEDQEEWITRFWVAKEAYGKMLGLGLQGNPKLYEIETIDGENLLIKNTWIKTAKHRNDFVIGWTQK
ncbi:MAG: 4'-phosphopantetheinyl transferase superfamily protein [Candidatus Azobacteroides sp.]|nr:4'-phosphopantetheinyl transferase superfamily protein [Candidatus Azobacteroides sp.]